MSTSILIRNGIFEESFSFGIEKILVFDPEERKIGFYIPFTVFFNGGIRFRLAKSTETQDHSISFWISRQPWGISPEHIIPRDNNFSIKNSGIELVISSATFSNVNFFWIQVIPGDYFINFKNSVPVLNRLNFIAEQITI